MEIAASLPESPGCYIFKDSSNSPIYIGKAKNIKKRVSSYFSKKISDAKTASLVRNISSVEFIIANNEIEALILENNLIKKYQPKYNILLKDSKRYAYLKITSEKFPRLVLLRKREEDSECYGPFTSAYARDKIAEVLIKTFKIRTCKRLPKRACLRYYIGVCKAPCIGKVSEEEYAQDINSVRLILNKKTAKLKEILRKKMQNFSDKKDFENAIRVRNQLYALDYLEERQNAERIKNYDEDIINYLRINGKVYLVLFNSKKGILETKQDFEFNYSEGFLEEFLSRYYSENKPPKRIILPRKPNIPLKEYLEKIHKIRVKIIIPKRGELRNLLDLAGKNLEAIVLKEEMELKELKDALNLDNVPREIECFDISHLHGEHIVASMVRFSNAKPNKKEYRRFKIRSVKKIDDFAAIEEVVKRRYSRLVSGKISMPDLIVIDGGKGQLSSAIKALESIGLKIPIIALAKKEEEIYIPNEKTPLEIKKDNKALHLLMRIRDEAHRFAVNYNRLLRKKYLIGKIKKN